MTEKVKKLYFTHEKKKEREHYVDNARLVESIKTYKKMLDNGDKNAKMPEYIGVAFIKMAERIGKKPNYSSYSYLDEMMDDAIENCIKGISSFDPERSPYAVSYFSITIMRAFHRRIEQEHQQNYVKHKYVEKFMDDPEIKSLIDMESSNHIIESYERKLENARKKNVTEVEIENSTVG